MRALGAALLLLVLAYPAAAAAEMIKWVDASGTIHFAESVGEIPPQFRAAAKKIPEYSAEDERVRIIPKEPEEEGSGWFGFGAADGDAEKSASRSSSSASSKSKSKNPLENWTFSKVLALLIVQYFVSVIVLACCTMMIEESVEMLGIKALGAIFTQRFLLFAAFMWISHTTQMNLVPESITIGTVAAALITPLLAQLGITAMILRYTICEFMVRAVMLSLIFCVVDGVVQILLVLGAVALVAS